MRRGRADLGGRLRKRRWNSALLPVCLSGRSVNGFVIAGASYLEN